MTAVPPESFDSAIARFLQVVRTERGLSDNTLGTYRADLMGLARYLSERSIPFAYTSRADVLDFIGLRVRGGARPSSTARQLSALRSFFRYCEREGVVRDNPTRDIAMPKIGRVLPRSLTETEIKALLSAPVITESLGLRDRAMLELLYATGLRVSELVNLRQCDVNLNKASLRTIGKGDRERLVPIGAEAIRWVAEFVQGGRQEILSGRDSEYLFPSRRGGRMTRQGFREAIKGYARKAGIAKHVSPHTIRHAFATHLVDHGADLRVVQMLLGHSSLSTTQIYTHVSRASLKNLHEKHHPRG